MGLYGLIDGLIDRLIDGLIAPRHLGAMSPTAASTRSSTHEVSAGSKAQGHGCVGRIGMIPPMPGAYLEPSTPEPRTHWNHASC